MKTEIKHCINLGIAIVLAASKSLAAPGDLYVGNGPEILRFSPDGTRATLFDTNDGHPQGFAFNRGGDLLVTDGVVSGIGEINSTGNGCAFSTSDSPLFAIAVDAAGNVFASDPAANAIHKFTPGGDNSEFASGLSLPSGLAFDQSGNLYEADSGSDTIFKFSPTGTRTIFASNLVAPRDLAFDRSGNLFVIASQDGTTPDIVKIDSSGTQSTFASEIYGTGMAFDESGNLFIVEFITGSIYKFTPAGAKTTFVNGLISNTFIAIEPTSDKLRNISSRGSVQTGDGVLIVGFIAGGNALRNNAVLVRALGPSLANAGITNPLADPTLELHGSDGTIIATNDDWQDDQAAQIMATGLAPNDPKESALYEVLPAGSYTAVVKGQNNTTGIALAEVYALEQ
jgi:sugar lactone lactonase YvrE